LRARDRPGSRPRRWHAAARRRAAEPAARLLPSRPMARRPGRFPARLPGRVRRLLAHAADRIHRRLPQGMARRADRRAGPRRGAAEGDLGRPGLVVLLQIEPSDIPHPAREPAVTWDEYYRGDGVPRAIELPAPPPWRTFPRQPMSSVFQPPPGLREAVNAALCLRRPLLITGLPGSGKSTVIEQVAAELDFGPVLRWHVTSRSTLADALYRYDALGRIHAQRLGGDRNVADDIAPFLQFGPLGTALLPAERPRALLIDEIDKSDLDLPSDLLDVLERGEFEVPELVRYEHDEVDVRLYQSDGRHRVVNGRIACTQFPFIVMTSN